MPPRARSANTGVPAGARDPEPGQNEQRKEAAMTARTEGTVRERATTEERLTHADRVAQGKDARRQAPLESHAEFAPDGPRDPVGLLIEQAKSRVPELVPIRNGRMLVSPFTYYRGAALPMAADLATTPTPGLRVQLCGDAHLSNFGAFASPSRRLVFDVNDFDETLPGPFEWDVKRLAAQPGGGRPGQRVRREGPPQDRAGGGRELSDSDARVRPPALHGRVVRAHGRRRGDQRVPVAVQGQKGQGHREDGGQGAHP